MAKQVVSPYKPRPLQAAIHKKLTRFSVLVCHRRFGKTIMSINHIILSLMQSKKKNPQYAYIAPEKAQAKKISWDEFKEYAGFIPGAKFYETELKITIPLPGGSTGKIYLEGADKPDRLRGMYFDGVVIDEVAQMPRSIWAEVVQPTLMGRGGWAVFIGTPKGKNYFEDLYKMGLDPQMQEMGWSSHMYKASETAVISAEELKLARMSSGADLFEQEYECSFKAVIPGAYYGTLIAEAHRDNRVRSVPADTHAPVITAWDIGLNDKTVIWFAQYKDGKLNLIDYYEDNNKPLKHYINVVKAKPYVYEYHIFPHDADHRSFNSGLTRTSEAVEAGLKVHVPKRRRIEDGINAVRSLLPISHFDSERCSTGLEALVNYHSKYDDRKDVQQLVPVHDWSSHASDAFRYLATGIILDKPGYTNFNKHPFQRGNQIKVYDDFDPYRC